MLLLGCAGVTLTVVSGDASVNTAVPADVSDITLMAVPVTSLKST